LLKPGFEQQGRAAGVARAHPPGPRERAMASRKAGSRLGAESRGDKRRGAAGLASGLGTAELEAIVFGGADPSTAEAVADDEGVPPKARAADAADAGDLVEKQPKRRKRKRAPSQEAGSEAKASGPGAAAWLDPDDAELEVDLTARSRTMKLRQSNKEKKVSGNEYERRLREHFVKLHGHAQWADEKARAGKEAGEDEDSASEEEAIPTSAKVVATAEAGVGALRPTELDVVRRPQVEIERGSKGPAVIQAVQFHPTSDLLLTAGFDKRLRLYAVDGDENAKVSSHFFKQFPIQEACFTQSGDEILLTPSRDTIRTMWSLDVRTGTPSSIRPMAGQMTKSKFHGIALGADPADQPGFRSSKLFSVLGEGGAVVVCDLVTKHAVRTLRMAAPGVAATFSTARDTLITADEESNIYEWDLGSGRCLQRMKEAWATKITALAMRRVAAHAPTPLLAVGTATGNIDFFDASGPKLPKEPTSTVSNLTTSVTSMRFHHGGEMLAAASKFNKDALKLVHAGSSTVFATWPTDRTPLHRVTAIDFSRRDGYLAIGNERGKVLLYQLTHYEKAGR